MPLGALPAWTDPDSETDNAEVVEVVASAPPLPRLHLGLGVTVTSIPETAQGSAWQQSSCAVAAIKLCMPAGDAEDTYNLSLRIARDVVAWPRRVLPVLSAQRCLVEGWGQQMVAQASQWS